MKYDLEHYICIAIKTNYYFYNKTLIEIANELVDRKQSVITAINPYSLDCLHKAKINIEYFDFVFIDGISLCYITKLLFNENVRRVSMDNSSLLNPLFEISNSRSLKICLVGGSTEEVELARNNISHKYPEIIFPLVSCGYFRDHIEMKDIQQRIIDSKPDIVLVSMGCVKQELFLIDLKKLGFTGLGITCGAFIKQTSKKLKYYPNYINRSNMRWLYRILMEPGLFLRYTIYYPKVILKIIKLGLFNKVNFLV